MSQFCFNPSTCIKLLTHLSNFFAASTKSEDCFDFNSCRDNRYLLKNMYFNPICQNGYETKIYQCSFVSVKENHLAHFSEAISVKLIFANVFRKKMTKNSEKQMKYVPRNPPFWGNSVQRTTTKEHHCIIFYLFIYLERKATVGARQLTITKDELGALFDELVQLRVTDLDHKNN